MDISTSTQLFYAIATTSGNLITSSFPFWIFLFGGGLALTLVGAMILSIVSSVKRI